MNFDGINLILLGVLFILIGVGFILYLKYKYQKLDTDMKSNKITKGIKKLKLENKIINNLGKLKKENLYTIINIENILSDIDAAKNIKTEGILNIDGIETILIRKKEILKNVNNNIDKIMYGIHNEIHNENKNNENIEERV